MYILPDSSCVYCEGHAHRKFYFVLSVIAWLNASDQKGLQTSNEIMYVHMISLIHVIVMDVAQIAWVCFPV